MKERVLSDEEFEKLPRKQKNEIEKAVVDIFCNVRASNWIPIILRKEIKFCMKLGCSEYVATEMAHSVILEIHKEYNRIISENKKRVRSLKCKE